MIIRLCQPRVLHSIGTRASSSFTPYKPNQPPEEEPPKPSLWRRVGTRVKNHFTKPKKTGWLFSGRSPAPLNFSYPNKKGIDDFEVYSDLDEISREVPKLVKDHTKVSCFEVHFSDKISLDAYKRNKRSNWNRLPGFNGRFSRTRTQSSFH